MNRTASRSSRRQSYLPLLCVALLVTMSYGTVATFAAGNSSGTRLLAGQAQEFTAKLELSPSTAVVGERITATGSGYEPDTDVTLVYHSVEGRYELKDGTEFIGQRYSEVTADLVTVRSDASGGISAQFDVPVGYGGPHDIRGRVDDVEVSQAGILVQPTLTMSPESGPIGTIVEITIVGVDLRDKINTWQFLYDNKYMGFAGAVTTQGVAVARFRAAGPVGTHVIQAYNNAYNSTPYLAWDTSPFRNEFEVPVNFLFEATSDPGYLEPAIDDLSDSDAPWPVDAEYPGTLALSVDRGVVGQPTTLIGSDLPADTELDVTFWTMVGNRVSGGGFVEDPILLGTVKTNAGGNFAYDMQFPDDLGGNHRIEVSSGGTTLAATSLMIIPSLISISPTEVRAGETVEIHLKGLGWTTYDNTYTVLYDNANVGYVCGFSTNGDVVFSMTVTGQPGTHLIDLVPTIYKGEEAMPKTFSVPMLTYAEDHPVRPVPAIRLSVVIVE